MQTPIVSIIIPFRNEENFILECINSVLNNDYPKQKMEILLIDGMSTDKSVEKINSLKQKYPFIKIIKNEKRIFPAAVNIGVKNSIGEVVIILGAHAKYDTLYISSCVKYLYELNADNVGGVLNTVGLNQFLIGETITAALSSSFGVGNSTFRTGSDKITEVDTVFGGCYKRSVFDKIGFFNENLISSSDMDFNVRLKKAGGKIFLIPDIVATYYTRSTFTKFIHNNVRNGFWAIYPIRFLDYIPVSLRHFIPFFFVSGIAVALFLSVFSSIFLWILSAVLILYFLAGFYFASKFLSKGFLVFLILPFFFFLLHLSYGIGSIWASIRVVASKLICNKKQNKI